MSNVDIKIHRPHISMKRDGPTKPSQRKVDDHNFIPEQYKKIAGSMEQQFADFMVKEMEKSVKSADLGTAGAYYKDLLRKERTDAITKNNNLGLQNLILDQIYPKQYRTKEAYEAYLRQNQSSFRKKNIEMHSVPQQEIQIASGKEAKELVNE